MFRKSYLIALLAALALFVGVGGAVAQQSLGAAFTYQGRLSSGTGAVNGACDFQFSLWDSPVAPATQIGSTLTRPDVNVANGLFTVQLDFGATAFGGDARWLEVAVRCPTGAGAYTTLTPRQELTAAPYALHASTADTLTDNIRTIARAHGVGPIDDVSGSGPFASRVLTFTKNQSNTGIRVIHTDNRSCGGPLGSSPACRLEIRFNGSSCSNPGPLIYDYHVSGVSSGDVNALQSLTTVGTCFGLPAGTYTIQVYGGSLPGYSSVSVRLGWYNSYWSLEAEEVK